MKKLITLLLIAALSLSLSACGKSDAVKAVEAMIAAFPGISAETEADACAIQMAYDELSGEEQKKVKGYAEFTAARDAYYEPLLSGLWYPFDLALHSPEYIFSPRCSITLNEDMTAVHAGLHSGEDQGSWSVENGKVVLQSIQNIDTETSSYYSHDGLPAFDIRYENGRTCLSFLGERTYLRPEDYTAALENVIRVVDLEETDPTEVMGFAFHRSYHYDEWGTETGSSIRAAAANLLYDEGWTFIGTSSDFALEILWPEYTTTTHYADGDVHTRQDDAGSCTVTQNPFNHSHTALTFGYFWDSGNEEADLTPEDLSFGRAKGKIYYLNSLYITDIRHNETTNNRELILNIAEYPFLGADTVSTLWWEPENQAY